MIDTKAQPGYSIIIPAHNASLYIEECLDSIQNQTHFVTDPNYEILLGIDGCKETLKKLESIKSKYDNLTGFFFVENKGPYFVRNDMLARSKYENIIFFDSDDTMFPEMVAKIDSRMKKGFEVCQFRYVKYENGSPKEDGELVTHRTADGQVCHARIVHEKLGGFEPWFCGADSDFKLRAENNFSTCVVDEPLFYRRFHKGSLTQRKDTGFGSEKRQNYSNIIKRRIKDGYYQNIEMVPILKRKAMVVK